MRSFRLLCLALSVLPVVGCLRDQQGEQMRVPAPTENRRQAQNETHRADDSRSTREMTLLREAEQLSTQRQWNASIEKFDDVRAINPQCIEALVGRGLALEELGDSETAIESFSAALEIDPHLSNALFYRARLYTNKGEFELAHADLTVSLDEGRFNIINMIALAIVNLHLERIDAALQDLEVVSSQLGTPWPAAHVLLARIRASSSDASLRNGELALAHAEFAHGAARAEIAHDPVEKVNPKIYDALAMAHAELGYFGDAITWEEKAIEAANDSEAGVFRERLELFQLHQPYRANGAGLVNGFHF